MADDPRIRATYDAVAAEYNRLLAGELAAKPLDRALLAAVFELAVGGTLADVGCGPGHVTRFLAEHQPDVVGVDLSPAMVALAREHHVDSAEFAAGDVNHLTSWFGAQVDLDGYFLPPDRVAAELGAAGLAVTATVLPEPVEGAEYPSRRCHLIARS